MPSLSTKKMLLLPAAHGPGIFEPQTLVPNGPSLALPKFESYAPIEKTAVCRLKTEARIEWFHGIGRLGLTNSIIFRWNTEWWSSCRTIRTKLFDKTSIIRVYIRSHGCEIVRDPAGRGAIPITSREIGEIAAGRHRCRPPYCRLHLLGFADMILSIASLTVKLAALARGGNSLKLSSRLATKACAGIRMNVRCAKA
jgi:hypothetical protein